MLSPTTVTYLFNISQFLPLGIFVNTYRITNSWPWAFVLGGIAAIIQVLAFIMTKRFFHRFILAANCFLIGGASMIVFNIHWLQELYSTFTQVTLFMWLLVIGIASTLFTSAGFIGLPGQPRSIVITQSLYLLAGAVAAMGVSWIFQGNVILAGMVPFVALIFLRIWLVKGLE